MFSILPVITRSVRLGRDDERAATDRQASASPSHALRVRHIIQGVTKKTTTQRHCVYTYTRHTMVNNVNTLFLPQDENCVCFLLLIVKVDDLSAAGYAFYGNVGTISYILYKYFVGLRIQVWK